MTDPSRFRDPLLATVACVECHREVTLPPVPDRPGWVSVEPMHGWTAPPPRCPECSAKREKAQSRDITDALRSDEAMRAFGVQRSPWDPER